MAQTADKRRMIIFEELTSSHKWTVNYYIFRQYEITFMRINEFAKGQKWVKALISRNILKQTNHFSCLHVFEGVDYDMAHDTVDYFYKVTEQDGIIKQCVKMYEDDAVNLIFKRKLHERLGRFYYLNRTMHDLQKIYEGRNIVFVPSSGNRLYRKAGASDIGDYEKFYRLAQNLGAPYGDTRKVKFSFWTKIKSDGHFLKNRMKIILQVIAFPALVFFVTLKGLSHRLHSRHKKNSYQYAIMIISPKRQFANNIQKLDFLIDGEKISKKEVLFLSRTRLAEEHKQYLKANGLLYEDSIDSYFSFSNIRKVAPTYLRLLAGSFREDCAISEEVLKTIYLYLRWASFSEKVQIRKLVSLSDFGSQSIARNIILKKIGCETYYYMDTTNYSFCYAPASSSSKFRDNVYSFLYYDYFISWNNAASRHFKDSQCRIEKYIDVGCLWAEHIKLIEEHKIDSDFQQVLRTHGYDSEKMKLISIFDSGYHDELIFNYADGIAFLRDILRLLADMPNIFIILKEKLPRDYHRKVTPRYKEILALYEALESHPRCYSIKRWENSSEIIAFNDLTISFPFTSSTVEAVSARKKAVWYDATGKFRKTFYDSIPHLVCHGYEELYEQVERLLKMKDEDYERYLNTHIKGRIESYLDGNAISRFRSFLSEGVIDPMVSEQNEVVRK